MSSMKKPQLIWTNVLLFSLTGFTALFVVPYYAMQVGFSLLQIIALVTGVVVCEISITAGYHRLWSHRAYEAHVWVRALFALGGAFAVQNSILHWSSDHRMHHRHVDNNDKDPYSAKRGFWYSHVGWMLRDYQTNPDSNYDNVRDLKKDPIVMWQHRNYLWLTLSLNFAGPILLGVLLGDVLGTFLLVGVLRLVLSHHMTFFINSLAHVWGKQPYDNSNTARDNGLIAFLTMGEGYHNYHHQFQSDYRNAIHWWQFDPTKWLIRSLKCFGLTRGLRCTPEEKIEQARAKVLLQQTRTRLANLPNAEVLIQRLQLEYDILLHKMNEFYLTRKQWLAIKRVAMAESCEKSAVLKRYTELKQLLAEQKKAWLMLNAQFA